MLKTFHISEHFFTESEVENFKEKFGFEVKEISYSSGSEIDFSNLDEKEFLLSKGYPKISARFYA